MVYLFRELAHEFLTRPIKVTIGSDDLAAGTRIKQIVEVVDDRARETKLFKLLKVSSGLLLVILILGCDS
jgi:hypothetical protein